MSGCGNLHQELRFQFPGLHLVHIAPDPGLTWFDRANKRVVDFVKVLCGVLVLGRVAAPHLSTRQAQAKMNPGIAGLHAFFANMFLCVFYFDLIEMRTLALHAFSKRRLISVK